MVIVLDFATCPLDRPVNNKFANLMSTQKYITMEYLNKYKGVLPRFYLQRCHDTYLRSASSFLYRILKREHKASVNMTFILPYNNLKTGYQHNIPTEHFIFPVLVIVLSKNC